MKKLIFVFVLGIWGFLFAQEKGVPGFLNFQGILKSQAGIPVDGEYTLTFKIYDSQTDGNLLWEETHENVTIKKGYFNVVLGSITPFGKDFFDTNRNLWVEITVGDDEVPMPRKKLLSVAFSFQAAKSDVSGKALSLECNGCVSDDQISQSLLDTINGAVTQEQLSSAKDELQENIDKVSGDISDLSTDYYAFKDSTNSTLNDLQTGIDNLNDKYQALENDYNSFKTDTSDSLNKIDGEIESLNSNLSDLSSSLDGVKSDVNSLSTDLSKLQTTVDDHIANKDIHKTVSEIFADIVANFDGEGSGLDADTLDGMHANDLKVEEHLIRNGSFEKGPSYWTRYPDNDDTGPIIVSTDDGGNAHTGKFSVKFTNDKEVSYDSKSITYKEFVPVKEGEGIHFSVWYFGESDLYNEQLSNFSIKLLGFDKNFQVVSEVLLGTMVMSKKGEGEWKEFTYDYKVPVSGDILFISLKVEAAYDSDRNYTFYIDDVDAISDSKSFFRLNSYAMSDKPGGAAIDLECSSCVESNEIADGTLVDADISENAKIMPKKIAGTAATLTGNQNFDNGTFYIDADNSRIGVGTTNPAHKFVVSGGWIEPASGYGIRWMNDVWGGNGDVAWIKYFSEGGENTKLQIGVDNDPDDDLELYQQGDWRIKLESGKIYLNGEVNCSGCIKGSAIKDGTISSADITDGTITGTDIANNTITGADIKDASIGGKNLKSDAVKIECTTVAKHFTNMGVKYVCCPAGYIMTGGGMAVDTAEYEYEQSRPGDGKYSNCWACDCEAGDGSATCYVRCCKITFGTSDY